MAGNNSFLFTSCSIQTLDRLVIVEGNI